MRDILVTAVVFGLLPMILRKPFVGVCAWAWLGYMNPHKLTWGFAYNMPFAFLVAIALMLSLLMTREKRVLPRTPLLTIWVIFVSWWFVTTLFALDVSLAWADLQKPLKIQLIALLSLLVITSKKRIDALLWVIFLSIGYYGIKGGVFVLLTGGAFRIWGPATTYIEGNNELGLALVMILPIGKYLLSQTQKRWCRTFLLVSMLLMTLSVLSTYSRGAFLAVVMMGLFMILKNRRKFAAVAVALLFIPAVIMFLPDQWFSRIETIKTYEADASAMQRIAIWNFAINLAKDHPITGGGKGAFNEKNIRHYDPEPLSIHDAHSIYFKILAEHGFVGLFLFLALGLTAMRAGTWIINHTKQRQDLLWANELARMLQVTLIGFAVGGTFLGLSYFDLIYHCIGILAVTQYIVRQELNAADQSESAVAGVGATSNLPQAPTRTSRPTTVTRPYSPR